MAKAYIAADKMSLPAKRKLEAKLEAAAEPTQEAAAFRRNGVRRRRKHLALQRVLVLLDANTPTRTW
jgi:predicted NAD-dependent protein-ADP-ribosyltransferase YbiA (DUF1768 family)